MANDALVQSVKKIMTLAKEGKHDEAHQGYGALFSSAEFATYRLEEQRQALRLVIRTKGVAPHGNAAFLEAYRGALVALKALTDAHKEPADYELLGICNVVLGNEKAAEAAFRTGLTLERERSPQSDLCGSLMKWLASV